MNSRMRNRRGIRRQSPAYPPRPRAARKGEQQTSAPVTPQPTGAACPDTEQA
ncbi:hypothetical protein ACIBK8_30445 [Streptomyces sp. NPDC050161]|uniref:hypothetical protein n=1 Tax=Streptomyces sp. NPDC050161 TaxID=3365604 RepID=UPI0037AF46A0